MATVCIEQYKHGTPVPMTIIEFLDSFYVIIANDTWTHTSSYAEDKHWFFKK